MALENTLVIRDLAALQMWRQHLRNILRRGNLPIVKFQLQEFSFEENRSLSALARRFQKACGCASSGFFMSVTVVALIVSYLVAGNHLSNVSLADFLTFIGITAIATLSGKLLGLLWARGRLLMLASNMHDKIIRAKQRIIAESI